MKQKWHLYLLSKILSENSWTDPRPQKPGGPLKGQAQHHRFWRRPRPWRHDRLAILRQQLGHEVHRGPGGPGEADDHEDHLTTKSRSSDGMVLKRGQNIFKGISLLNLF